MIYFYPTHINVHTSKEKSETFKYTLRNATMLLIQLSLSTDVLPSCFTCKCVNSYNVNNWKFSTAYTKLVTMLSPWNACFTQQQGKAWVFFEQLYVRAFCQIAVLRINNFRNIKNLKWIIYPMRKGAANSKRMCIICHWSHKTATLIPHFSTHLLDL